MRWLGPGLVAWSCAVSSSGFPARLRLLKTWLIRCTGSWELFSLRSQDAGSGPERIPIGEQKTGAAIRAEIRAVQRILTTVRLTWRGTAPPVAVSRTDALLPARDENPKYAAPPALRLTGMVAPDITGNANG